MLLDNVHNLDAARPIYHEQASLGRAKYKQV